VAVRSGALGRVSRAPWPYFWAGLHDQGRRASCNDFKRTCLSARTVRAREECYSLNRTREARTRCQEATSANRDPTATSAAAPDGGWNGAQWPVLSCPPMLRQDRTGGGRGKSKTANTDSKTRCAITVCSNLQARESTLAEAVDHHCRSKYSLCSI
jgi:hypothetical protein